MVAASSGESLFAQLGGTKSVEAVTEEFYKRVLGDKELSPFFSKTNMTWLKLRQTQFFTQALGGPAIYKGKPMREAHNKMAIEAHHFQKVAQHLTATLKSLGVSQVHMDEVLKRVGSLYGDIVNSGKAEAKRAGNEAK